jgi:hypothetical protein
MKPAELRHIIWATSRVYGRPISYILQHTRKREVLKPRQVIQYLSKVYTSSTLREIAEATGLKNHATIINSIKKMEFEYGVYPDTTMLIDDVKEELIRSGRSLDGATAIKRRGRCSCGCFLRSDGGCTKCEEKQYYG